MEICHFLLKKSPKKLITMETANVEKMLIKNVEIL